MKITALVKLKRKAQGELSLMVDMCFHGSPAPVSDANPHSKREGLDGVGRLETWPPIATFPLLL